MTPNPVSRPESKQSDIAPATRTHAHTREVHKCSLVCTLAYLCAQVCDPVCARVCEHGCVPVGCASACLCMMAV